MLMYHMNTASFYLQSLQDMGVHCEKKNCEIKLKVLHLIILTIMLKYWSHGESTWYLLLLNDVLRLRESMRDVQI